MGQRADLLLVDGDPTTTISDTLNIRDRVAARHPPAGLVKSLVMTTAYRVDVHAHFPVDLPRPPGDQGLPWSSWNTEDAIRRLDRCGSGGSTSRCHRFRPQARVSGPRSGRAGRRRERQVRVDHRRAPDRFGAFATVPGDDIDAALAEARHALDVLGLHGLALTSNSNGRYLGDPWYEPLFALAQSRGVPVFVHPALDPRPHR